MKMKIELHLEVVAWIKDMNLYLKPVGKMGLFKNLKVLGYFCLEQTCYLGIVYLLRGLCKNPNHIQRAKKQWDKNGQILQIFALKL